MSERFPRSLRQAFPAERFAALEISRPRSHLGDRVVLLVSLVIAVCLIFSSVFS